MATSTIRNIVVRVGADTRSLSASMKRAQRIMKQSSKNMKILAGTMAAAIGIGFAAISKNATRMATDVIESENLFTVSMGDMADSARQFSEELADSLGLNAFEIRKNVGVLFNMTTSMGIATDKAYEMSTGMTQLAFDMASFYNLSHEEAFNKIASGITGETEPLARLGIIIKQNALEQEGLRLGIRKSFDTWTEQEKILVRYNAIMTQTVNANGDLARTLNSPANQMRRFGTQVDLAMINLGRGFLVIQQKVMPILISLAKVVVQATAAFANFMQVLFGVSTEEMQGLEQQSKATADGIGSVGDAAKEAGKKAKGSVAGFDEINQLQDKMASSADAAGSGIAGFGLSELDATTSPLAKVGEASSEAAEKIRKFFKVIIDNKENIIVALSGITTAIIAYTVAVNAAKIASGLSLGLKGILAVASALSLPMLALAAAVGTVGALITKYFIDPEFKSKVDDIWNGVVESITSALDTAWKFLEETWGTIYDFLEPLFTATGEIFTEIWEGIKKVGEDAWNGILEVWNTVKEAMEPAVTKFGETVSEIWDALEKAGISMWNKMKETWDTVEPVLRIAIQLFSDFVLGIWEGIKSIGISTWEDIKDNIKRIWENNIKPVVEEIGLTLEGTFESSKIFIVSVIESIEQTFNGFMDFIKGVFSADWKTAWEGMANVFEGIAKGIFSVFEGIVNLFIDGINLVIRSINRLSQVKVPDWIPKYGGQTFSGFKIEEIGKFGAKQPSRISSGATYGTSLINSVISQGLASTQPLPETAAFSDVQNNFINSLREITQSQQQSGSEREVSISIDGTELARALIPKMSQEQTRIGSTAIITTR